MISLSDVDLLAKIRPLTLVDLKVKKFYFIYREEDSVVVSDEANLLHLTSRFTVPSFTTKNNKYIKKISKYIPGYFDFFTQHCILVFHIT